MFKDNLFSSKTIYVVIRIFAGNSTAVHVVICISELEMPINRGHFMLTCVSIMKTRHCNLDLVKSGLYFIWRCEVALMKMDFESLVFMDARDRRSVVF